MKNVPKRIAKSVPKKVTPDAKFEKIKQGIIEDYKKEYEKNIAYILKCTTVQKLWDSNLSFSNKNEKLLVLLLNCVNKF
jgi:DhnA family fructose-bisphosphate aldolase class Ia